MKYGIKIRWQDGEETWMMGFPEYLDAEATPMEYNTKIQAEDAAKSMNLTNYRIEEIERTN